MFSILFCVNRSNPYLERAINSVLSQTFREFELLISANACDDSLIDEIKLIVGEDTRVKIFRSIVPQLSYNLNYLVDNAAYDWLVRMDADDISEPSRLESINCTINACDADVIGSWATLIDENDTSIGRFQPRVSSEAIRRMFPFTTQICHPTVAFKRSFYLKMRGYLGGFVSEDYDLWLRALNSGGKFQNIPIELLRYRIHSGQVSRSRLGYAEVASHWHREVLLRPSLFNLTGWVISTTKATFLGIFGK